MKICMPSFIKRRRISLGCNFVFLVISILSITMGVSVYYNYRNDHNNLIQQLESRGKLIGNFVADVSKSAIVGYDFVLLDQYMEDIASNEEVVYSIIIAADKTNLTSHLNDVEKYISLKKTDDHLDIINKLDKHPSIIAQRFPIYVDSSLIGTLALGLTREHVTELAWVALRNQLVQSGVIILILSISISIVFRRKALKPIQELINRSDDLANGNYKQVMHVSRSDELARLAESFNSMAEAIQHTNVEKDNTLNQLQETNQKLENATMAKSNFLANMSHEIRTPLTAILGYAESLKYDDATTDAKEEAINSILKNGQHLQHIISEILDLTKIEANRLEIEKLEVSPITLLHEFENLIALYARSKDLEFRINYNLPLPERIETDPVRLKQILLNLCNNAIKFTHRGRIDMEVSFIAEYQMIEIMVRDTGIGMTEEQCEKIFQPFTQADTSTTREYGGTGLGLALSKKLAKKMGGNITVNSLMGSGSQFTLTIDTGPISVSGRMVIDDTALQAASLHSKLPAQAQQQLGGRILLAEDTVDNQKLFSLQIKRMGPQLDIANNGAEAVEAIQQHHYDLVLLDMQMPVMDGMQAINKIRSLGIETPVIALTANAIKEFRQACLDAGCNDYLSKPVDWPQFRDTLALYLPAIKDNEPLNPLHSKLVEQDPEFEDIVKGFLGRLHEFRQDILHKSGHQEWEACNNRIHELKGLGGAMGYPELSLAAKEVEDQIKACDYVEARRSIEKLLQVFDRMQASISVEHSRSISA